MTAVVEKQEQKETVKSQAKSLFKKGLYLQAKQLCEKHWGEIQSWTEIEQLNIATTIYSHLGGDRNSDAISVRLFKHFPNKSEHIVSYWYYVINKYGCIIAEELFNQTKDTVIGSDAEEDKLVFEAILQRQFHNFERSEELLTHALTISTSKTWINSLKTANLIAQDKFKEAYTWSKAQYESDPKISSLRSYFNATQHFKGLEEAIEIYWQELPKYESASLWLDCAVSLADLLKWSECEFAVNKYESLRFADDKWTRKTSDSLKGQILLSKGEYEYGKDILKNCKQYYWETVSKNIEQFYSLINKPAQFQVILDVPFYRQKHLTCAPTSMAAISKYLGREHDSEAIAEEICFDGTPDTKERQWLRKNDFHFEEFELQQDLLIKLIDLNIPFALCTTSGFTGHMQVVIGYNLKYGTMYIMDPSSPAMQEMLIKETIKKEAYLGARCIAFVPCAIKHKLDFIKTTCSKLYPVYDSYRLARQAQDVSGMQTAINNMRAIDATHRITAFAERDLACFNNDVEQIQIGNERLLKFSPNETILLNSQYFCIRDRGERHRAIEQLKGYLDKNNDRDLTETLFNEISDTNEDPALVKRLLLKLKRTGHNTPSIYDSIANYYWTHQEFKLAQKYYFIAHCLDDTDARYAENYFKTSNIVGEKDQALAWLIKRFDKYKTRSSSPAISLYQSYCTVNKEAKGIEVLQQALAFHPNDTDLISILANALADTGNTDELAILLQDKKGKLSDRLYTQLLARLKQVLGLLNEASACYKKLYSTAPFVSELATPYFRSLSRLGDTNTLDSEIERLINENPDTPKVYFYAADWHSSSEYLANVLTKAINIRPDNWYLYESRINALIRINKYAEAIEVARFAQSHFNNGTFQTAVLAKCFYYNESFEDARYHANQVLLKDVDNETALWVLTVTCVTEEQKLSSLKFVKEQIKVQHSVGNGIWHYWYEGQSLLSREELQDYVDTILERYENDWFTYCVASQFYSYFNLLQEAIEILNKGQSKFPLVPRLYSEQAEVYIATGDILTAIELNQKALGINPAWDTVAKRLAELYEKQGDMLSAVEVTQTCLSHNMQDGILHGYCADYLIKLGRKEEALSSIVNAIRFNIDYPWAWEKLEELSNELDKFYVAEELSNELARQWPNLAALWRFKAHLSKQRQHKVQYLKEAIHCDPMDQSSYAQLANIYTRQGEFQSAIDLFSNTPWGELLPVDLAMSKADLLANTGQTSKGVDVLWNILRNQSGWIQAWRKLYKMLEQIMESDSSYKAKIVGAATRHIELNPHQPDALCIAAEQLLEHGEKEKATETLKRAYELAPSDEYIMLTYADRLIELEQFEEALQCLTDFEKFELVSFALARKVNVLTKLKNNDQALETYKLLISNHCEVYGTLSHAFNALSKVIDPNLLVVLLGGQLNHCTRMQANLWADKFIEYSGKGAISRLLIEMENISSPNSWAGAFSGLLDYWQDKNFAPDDEIVNKYIRKIQQDNELTARLLDVNVQAGHYYNAVHLMEGIEERSGISMAALYQYAICLLMLGRGNDASLIISEGLNAEPDHTLHNLLVWHHADKWMQSRDINLEELNYIDRNELIEAESYIVQALELMGSLDEQVDLNSVKADLIKLKKSYREVEGLTTCDNFHRNCLKAIKAVLKPDGFWQRVQVNFLLGTPVVMKKDSPGKRGWLFYRNMALALFGLVLGTYLLVNGLTNPDSGIPKKSDLTEVSGALEWSEKYKNGVKFKLETYPHILNYPSKADATGEVYRSFNSIGSGSVNVLLKPNEFNKNYFTGEEFINVYQIHVNSDEIRNYEQVEEAWISDNILGVPLGAFFLFAAVYIYRKAKRGIYDM